MSNRTNSRPVAGRAPRRAPAPRVSRPTLKPQSGPKSAAASPVSRPPVKLSRASLKAWFAAYRVRLLIIGVVLTVLAWAIALMVGPGVSGLW